MNAVVEQQRPRIGSAAFKLAFGFALSGLFLYAMLATVPPTKVLGAIASASGIWIAVALLAIAAGYAFRILRWIMMLRSLGARPSARDAATGFLGAVAFNNVLPLRAGDMIRIVAFERLTGLPPAGQVGVLVLERLLDLLVLMFILFATLSIWHLDMLDEALLAGLRFAAIAVAGAILIFILAPRPLKLLVRWSACRIPRLHPAGTAIVRLLDAVDTLSRPHLLLKVTALSFVGWLFEGGAFYAVGHALGVAATPEAALLAVSIGTLATIIPSSPGHVGTFHYFTAKVVVGLGAAAPAAAAYAILIHGLLWISTTLSGFLLLASSGYSGRRRLTPSQAAASE